VAVPPEADVTQEAKMTDARSVRLKHRIDFALVCAAILLLALQTWARRNDMLPDGISYIEIASATAQHGFRNLVNAYWSPLYPALLSVVFRLFHPSLYWEFTVVHLTNFAILLFNLACFRIFLNEVIAAQKIEQAAGSDRTPLSPSKMRNYGYALFFWVNVVWLSAATVSPDLLVAAFAYLATAILLRIYRGPGSTFLYAALGVVLGAAYLAKAAMFPLAFVFLAASLFAGISPQRSLRRAIPRTCLALVVFVIVAAPFISALFHSKHRFTFGDAGKIAYTEYVDGAPLSTHWQGEPAGTGIPVHPTRKILANPPVYEFSHPIPGSYPPWRDPSYWYEGVTPHFSIKGQARILWSGFGAYFKMFSRTGVLYIIFVALLVSAPKTRWQFRAPAFWLICLPSAAALLLYWFVHVEERYVGGFAFILLIWIFSSVRIAPHAPAPSASWKQCASLAITIAPMLAFLCIAGRDALTLNHKNFTQWQVAQQLHKLGVPAQSQVAYIGTGLDAYWAHLANVRIIAEIPERNIPDFLRADSAHQQQAFNAFATSGAVATLTKNPAVANFTPGWQPIPDTPYYLRPALHDDPPRSLHAF
jgi:hypothetical protein